MIVVDSSIALQWALPESGREQSLKLLDQSDLIAPDILVVEVANVLAKKVRGAEMNLLQAQNGLRLITMAVSRLVNSVDLAAEALRLSSELSHPVYDCCFLACAIRHEAKLATRDRRFANRIAAGGLDRHLLTGGEAL